jgi:hypothetical protein
MPESENITEQELRDMPLHDTKELNRHIKIVKVVGGWIYWNEVPRLNAVAGVFVPLVATLFINWIINEIET